MKKMLLIIFAFLFVFTIVGCKEKLTVLEEFNNEYDAFMNEYQKTLMFESYVTIETDVYESEVSTTPILDNSSNVRMKVDSNHQYVYMRSFFDEQNIVTDVYMPYESEIIHYQHFDNEFVMVPDHPISSEITSLLEGNMTSDSRLVLLNTQSITKNDSGEYLLSISVNDLAGEDKDTITQFLTGIGVSEEDQTTLNLNFVYRINLDNNAMTYSLNIPKYLEQRSEKYFEINMEMVIQVVSEMEYIDFNDYGPVFQSAKSISDPMFTFSGPKSFELMINFTDNNFFSMYLEKGYYVFDSEILEESNMQVEVYDPSGNMIEGGPVFAIEESGIYKVNYHLETDLTGFISVYSYKYNPLSVGTPENPMISSSSTITVDYTENLQDVLLFESAPANGVIAVKQTSTGLYHNYPFYGIKAPISDMIEDGTNDLISFVEVREGQTVILHFDGDASDMSITYEWEFISQEENTTDISLMPSLNQDETTIIYIDQDQSEIHYKLEIASEGDYLFNYALSLSKTIYGTCRVSLYSEAGELITHSLQLSSLHLLPGTYVIYIDQINGVLQEYEYENTSFQYYLLFAYDIRKIS